MPRVVTLEMRRACQPAKTAVQVLCFPRCPKARHLGHPPVVGNALYPSRLRATRPVDVIVIDHIGAPTPN